jgi:hypothetical protein
VRLGRVPFIVLLILCVPGVYVLSRALHNARTTRNELRSWPRVEAHVDSAAIESRNGVSRQNMYAPRLWVTYRYARRTYAKRITGNYNNDWVAAAHAVDSARRTHTVTLMIDPSTPTNVTSNAGYTVGFFIWPLMQAGMSAVLLFIGIGLGVAAGKSSTGATGTSRTSPAFHTTPRRNAALAGTLAIVLLAGMVAILVRWHRRPTNWVATRAVVDSADVVRQSFSSTSSRSSYTVRLWVGYTIGGRAYHRPVLTGEAWTNNQSSVERQARAIRAHAPVDLLVDPDDPYRATMDATVGGSTVVTLTFGGLAVVLLGIARHRRRAARLAPA